MENATVGVRAKGAMGGHVSVNIRRWRTMRNGGSAMGHRGGAMRHGRGALSGERRRAMGQCISLRLDGCNNSRKKRRKPVQKGPRAGNSNQKDQIDRREIDWRDRGNGNILHNLSQALKFGKKKVILFNR